MNDPVVFDCMVYLQAVTSLKSPSRACFALAESGLVQLQTSEMILNEIYEVLTRPATFAHFPQLTTDAVEAFITWVRSFAKVATVVPKQVSYTRDPDDEPYLNLAIATQASYLVSRDKDLLDLMGSNDDFSVAFRKQFPDLQIVDVVAFLEQITSR